MKFVKLLIRSVIGFLFLAGISTVLFMLYFGYCALWNMQVIQQYIPQPPPPEVVMPVTLRLHGPRFVVKGDRAFFYAVSTGKTGKVNFSISPPEVGALNQISDTVVEFSSFEERAYTITAVVAGAGNQAAAEHLQFDNVTIAREEDLLPPPQEQPVSNPVQIMAQPQPEPPPSASELTRGAYNQVMSQDKASEAREVANVIFTVVRRLDKGMLAPNANIPLEIKTHVKLAMKERADAWMNFTDAIYTIREEYQRQGKVTTAASQKDMLMEIANTLASAR